MWNDDSMLVVSDEYKKIAWESCHKNLLNTEFTWDKDSSFEIYKIQDFFIFCAVKGDALERETKL